VEAATEKTATKAGERTSGKTEAPAAGPSGNGSFDELAFLHSVVDTPTTTNDKKSAAPAAPSAAAEAPAPPPPAPPPAPGSAGKGSAPAPPARPAEPVRHEAVGTRGQEDKIINLADATGPKLESKKKGLAANISGNNPIILKDKPGESAKTLKCGECGAMNYPTEWYCERCGAELASL
jgi:hypothetical protein